ncbi:hypothetical protein ARMSODRAFT_976279 [Armillaria solidipes]|uniref:Uncharacterized protein n=1 Tax=Armillaria solidipes TaxID=1076256 RepID=A0A2H3BVQ7_9AGAR|nr:hypothetical protein ARMSODRAFT_976279 [Armillaria solidipes]
MSATTHISGSIPDESDLSQPSLYVVIIRQQEQELSQLRLHYSNQRSMEYLLDKLEARIVGRMQEMEERVHQRLSSIETMISITEDGRGSPMSLLDASFNNTTLLNVAPEVSPMVQPLLSLRQLHTIHLPPSRLVKLTKTILESKLINGFRIIGWWRIVAEWPICTHFATALGVRPIIKNTLLGACGRGGQTRRDMSMIHYCSTDIQNSYDNYK